MTTMTTNDAETVAYVGLGSNLGERRAQLRTARARLEAHSQIRLEACSRLYESQSVESGGDHDFLNAVVRLRTSLQARELLAVCQSIEAEMGRENPVLGAHRIGPRVIDLDIVLFGEESHAALELVIPHPRALFRPFVLRPLLDVLQTSWTRVVDENW